MVKRGRSKQQKVSNLDEAEPERKKSRHRDAHRAEEHHENNHVEDERRESVSPDSPDVTPIKNLRRSPRHLKETPKSRYGVQNNNPILQLSSNQSMVPVVTPNPKTSKPKAKRVLDLRTTSKSLCPQPITTPPRTSSSPVNRLEEICDDVLSDKTRRTSGRSEPILAVRKPSRVPEIRFDTRDEVGDIPHEEVPFIPRGNNYSGENVVETAEVLPGLSGEDVSGFGGLQAADVDIVETSHLALTTSLKRLHSMFKSSLHTLTSSVRDNLKSLEYKVDNVATELNDIRAIISKTSVSGSKSVDTPLGRFTQKLNNATPDCKWVFDRECVHRCLCANVPAEVMKIARERGGDMANKFATAIHTIICAKQPRVTRQQFREGIGKRHIQFKHAVVTNAIYNVQRNRFGKFHDEVENESCQGTATERRISGAAPVSGVSMGNDESSAKGGFETSDKMPESTREVNGKIKQPKWLKRSFILASDIEYAKIASEYSKSESRKRKPVNSEDEESGYEEENEDDGEIQAPAKLEVKDIPSVRDIARHGAMKVYTAVGGHLNEGRKKAKKAFFEHLAFFMASWSGCGIGVEQESLTIKWAYPNLTIEGGRMQDLGDTRRNSDGDVLGDEYNTAMLAELFKQRKDMMLLVQHEVLVTEFNGSGKRKRSIPKKRTIRKSLHVIEAAAKFCAEFVHGPDPERSPLPFLRGHKDALRCILGIAIVFKELTRQFLVQNTVDGELKDVSKIDVMGIEIGLLKLSDLIPGASPRNRLLSTRVLKMTVAEYTKLNIALRANGSSGTRSMEVDGSSEGTWIGKEIQPSIECGVFDL